mgnify:CR=1 FL=1
MENNISVNRVLNKRTNEVVEGSGKLPSANDMEYGEIAVNYHEGYESIMMKNDNDDIITLPTNATIEDIYDEIGSLWEAIRALSGSTV